MVAWVPPPGLRQARKAAWRRRGQAGSEIACLRRGKQALGITKEPASEGLRGAGSREKAGLVED